MTVLDQILTAGYFLGVAGSIVFVARYLWVPWWRTLEGRAMIGLHASWGLLGFVSAYQLATGHYPLHGILAAVGVFGLLVSIWSCTRLLFKAQNGSRRNRKNQDQAKQNQPTL